MQIEPIASIQVSVDVSGSSETNKLSEEILKQADEAFDAINRLGGYN